MKRRSVTGFSIAALVVATAAIFVPSLHAQPAAEDELLFEGAVEVPVVNVEVHVLDGDGRPVAGLRPEDFEVYEDGERVEITNFYAVEGLPRRDKDLPVRMRGTPSPPRTVELPEEDRLLQLILYIDNGNMGPLGRRRVSGELLDLFDERLARGDRVMVVSAYPSLKIHTSFTRDLAAVHQAVKDALDRSATSSADMQRRRLINLFERMDTQEPALVDTIQHSIRLYAEEKSVEVRRTLWELRAFVSSLAGLPGRKVVLHLSDGVPEEPGQDMFNMFNAAFGGPGTIGSGREQSMAYNVTRELLAVAEEANASGVTFHTLDASGGDSSAISTPVETRGLSLSGARISGPEIDALRQQNLQNPLRMLATETGGVAVLNAARPGLEITERQGEVFDTYYSLGYISPHDENGRFRAIRVEVGEPGLRVRHREGYIRKDAFERVESRTVAALLHEYADNPLGVFLEVGEPARRKKGRGKSYQVPVAVKVPLDKVVLLPFAEDHRGRLRLRVGFRNEDGTFALAEEQVIPLIIPNDRYEEAQAGHYTLEVDLELKPGSHRVAVGVFDEVGSKASFVPHDLYIER